MPGNDNNANAPAATGASKMLAMLPKITKWVTSGDANALSSRNRSSWRAARINFIMALNRVGLIAFVKKIRGRVGAFCVAKDVLQRLVLRTRA